MRKAIDFIFSDKQYHWMLRKLPFRLMYKHKWIDSQHQIWYPRWGWSKIQMEEAKNSAEQYNNIKWQ